MRLKSESETWMRLKKVKVKPEWGCAILSHSWRASTCGGTSGLRLPWEIFQYDFLFHCFGYDLHSHRHRYQHADHRYGYLASPSFKRLVLLRPSSSSQWCLHIIIVLIITIIIIIVIIIIIIIIIIITIDVTNVIMISIMIIVTVIMIYKYEY